MQVMYRYVKSSKNERDHSSMKQDNAKIDLCLLNGSVR